MKWPLVTIVVPVYNVKEFLRGCLETVVGQTYENFEVIIVDDGSNDGSEEICEEFKSKRVAVFHKKNGGLSSARNYGLERAKGEWICFVDSDDRIKVDYVEKMMRGIIRHEADIAICGFNDEVPREKVISGRKAAIELFLKQENIEIVAWNKIYRKSLFFQNGIVYPEGQKFEDSLTTYKLLMAADKVIYVPEVLYIYNIRSGSIMDEAKIEQRLKKREKAAREAIKYCEKDRTLKKAAEVGLLLAKYAFYDAYLRGEIDEKLGNEAKEWILKNANNYKNNNFLSYKLRIYNVLMRNGDGNLYKVFRQMRHE